VRKAQITDLESEKNEPQALAQIRLSRALYPFPRGDVRAAMSVDEEIEDLGSKWRLRRAVFYRDFYGASPRGVVVVGDFDPAAGEKASTEFVWLRFKSPAQYSGSRRDCGRQLRLTRTMRRRQGQRDVHRGARGLNLSDNDASYTAWCWAIICWVAGS